MTEPVRYGMRSLRFKLVLASVVVEVLMLTVLVWNSTRITRNAMQEIFQNRVEVLVPLLNASLANPLAQRDFATLGERLRRIVRKESLVYIEVRDELGQLAASRGDLPAVPHLDRSIESARDVFDQEFDITLAGRTIGRARYGLNVGLLETTLASLRNQSILVATAEIVLSVLLLATLGALLTRRLLTLAQAARALQGGDYSTRVPVVSRDEVADTAQAFNAMADALARDVTDRKHAEAALRESEERLRLALDAAHMGTFDWDVPANRITWSRWHEELWGFKPGEFNGTYEAFAQRVHPEDLPGIDAEVKRCIAARAPFAREFRVVWPDASVLWIVGRGEFTFDANGQPLRMRGAVVDITARKRAEDQLRERERWLSSLIGNLPGAVFRVRNDPNYTAEFISDQIATLTGYPADDFRENRRNFGELMHPDDRDWVWNETQKALGEHRPYEVTYRFIDAHGQEKWNWERGSGIFDANGELKAIEGFVLDVTARKQAERQVAEYAERLEQLSRRLLAAQEDERHRLARELHDELGQALTAIKINLQARSRFKNQSPAELDAENVRLIEEAIQQVRRLALALRPSMLDDLGLAPALRWMAEQVAERSGFGVQFGADFPDTRPAPDLETTCFRIAQEALTNIARHAQAKRVVIELRHQGDELLMTVQDDGRGFDAIEARARATAGGSVGVLGMQERAELAGGKIEIESAPGRGTVVRARFPWRAAGAEA